MIHSDLSRWIVGHSRQHDVEHFFRLFFVQLWMPELRLGDWCWKILLWHESWLLKTIDRNNFICTFCQEFWTIFCQKLRWILSLKFWWILPHQCITNSEWYMTWHTVVTYATLETHSLPTKIPLSDNTSFSFQVLDKSFSHILLEPNRLKACLLY